tara:strand:+ start:135 stop:395 length:261 start_codon:yes stop_codon:yes gene_type:complete
MKHQAIYDLYPNVKTIDETDEVFFPKDENGNLVSIDMSAVETKATELQSERDAKEEADKNLKASAKAKLIAGEPLTEEEASLMLGG